MYRRLAPELDRSSDGNGLCFETQILDLDPAELLDAVGQYAPVGLAATDETRQWPPQAPFPGLPGRAVDTTVVV
ncbi:hypothetical protein [Streptomyces sp. NPDC005407]|uniref:hypothetical protein n=1 Tax=Streptomyces sp. NPDC005407 TaxID=3155340 RepID=UPI0033AECE9C